MTAATAVDLAAGSAAVASASLRTVMVSGKGVRESGESGGVEVSEE